MANALKLTPMMQQYYDLKEQYPDSILFFRLGDFYEMFGEDAKIASEILGIALTSREAGAQGRIPMCGVPHHAAEGYLAKLIEKGHRVALCEQLEDPKTAQGVVKRGVVKVITPGTFIEGELVDKENQYLVALAFHKNWGLASIDLSTGQFMVATVSNWVEVEDELNRLKPAEIIFARDFPDAAPLTKLAGQLGAAISTLERGQPSLAKSSQDLLAHFGTSTLTPFGLDDAEKIIASGLALEYVSESQQNVLPHIRKLNAYNLQDYLHIDAHSQRNLELTKTIREGRKEGSLLGILDYTATSMGGRLLRVYLEKPLVQIEKIRQRQEAVDFLVKETALRLELRDFLGRVYDLERLLGRLVVGSGNARDLKSLADSLENIPGIKELFKGNKCPLLMDLKKTLDPLEGLTSLIHGALVSEPPPSLLEGNLIRPGYNQELDQLRDSSRSGKKWIRNLESIEREKTGIKSLKVGFNRVFGYYLEVTNPNVHLVPEHYQRKQTLANAERYITPELKEHEALVLGAEERIKALEYKLFVEIRDEVQKYVDPIQHNAQALAALDVLQSLACAAVTHNYVRPEVVESEILDVSEGRHAVIEALEGTFVPNSIYFDRQQRIILLTGPNMAGKSTYLRQVALIVILAQMGSFIPAKKGKIGLVDRIFTRIGASDDLSSGQSTFMVECTETAELLLNASKRSLIILDELGRGTSTFDGMAIAQAVIEHIHDQIGARTLFSTHFHELTKLEQVLDHLATYRVEVEEKDGNIYFLHKVSRGITDRSYGINVARMAGIPAAVLKRSLELLVEFEAAEKKPRQLDLFTSLRYDAAALVSEDNLKPKNKLAEEILKLDLNNLTPLEALQTLSLLQIKAKEGDDER